MRRFVILFPIVTALVAQLLFAGCSRIEKATGETVPDKGWLFLGKGPYTLNTKVNAAPGSATLELVADLSLMNYMQGEDSPVILSRELVVAADSSISVNLGKLDPGFYQVRLRDSVRWNIGVRPDAVKSLPDAPEDFDAFWEQTLAELASLPLEPQLTLVPEHSDSLRSTYEVRYTSFGGQTSGGLLTIPNKPGKYPVWVQYMGYGSDPYWEDPSANPGRIDYLVSTRDQGLFKDGVGRWIDRGLSAKEDFYYRGAFCDAKRAIDFVASLDKADPGRIVVHGESQGGALTCVAAALDSRVAAAAPSVPFLGDFPDYAKIVWWPMHEIFDAAKEENISRESVLDMMKYFDVKNFAPKISCPVRMSFGLQDPTCPPHTNFSIYNNLSSTDKQYLCVPDCGHQMWLQQEWKDRKEAFLSRF